MKSLTPRRGTSTPSLIDEMNQLQRSIDRMFQDWWGNSQTPALTEDTQFQPPCEVDELEGHYVISLDIPGVSKDDLNIEVRDNQLVISGERRNEHLEKAEQRRVEELFYGNFLRTFALPTDVNASDLEASYDHGVLQISLPKTEAKKPTKVEIQEGKGNLLGRLSNAQKDTKKTQAA